MTTLQIIVFAAINLAAALFLLRIATLIAWEVFPGWRRWCRRHAWSKPYANGIWYSRLWYSRLPLPSYRNSRGDVEAEYRALGGIY